MAGIQEATQMVTSYFDPATKLIYAIGAVIGLIGAVILVAASIFMYVPVDERVEQITGCLPGANCGACGYNTCREKAIAVYQGKADINMCLPFLTQKAESFSDTIISTSPNGIMVLNEDLEVQQINSAACRIMNIRHASDVLGDQVIRILDPEGLLGCDVHRQERAG